MQWKVDQSEWELGNQVHCISAVKVPSEMSLLGFASFYDEVKMKTTESPRGSGRGRGSMFWFCALNSAVNTQTC